MKPRRAALELLREAINWRRNGDAFEANVKSPTGGVYAYRVTAQDLAEVHPWLPDTLKLMCDSYQRTFLYPPEIRALLNFWKNKDCLVFSDNRNSQYVVDSVSNMARLKDKHMVVLSAYGYRVFHFSTKEHAAIPYFLGADMHEIEVTERTMDKRFPEWRTRFTIATELGVVAADLFNYVSKVSSPDAQHALPVGLDLAGNT